MRRSSQCLCDLVVVEVVDKKPRSQAGVKESGTVIIDIDIDCVFASQRTRVCAGNRRSA